MSLNYKFQNLDAQLKCARFTKAREADDGRKITDDEHQKSIDIGNQVDNEFGDQNE